MKILSQLSIGLLGFISLALGAVGAERVAFVVGNNAYEHGTKLTNCVNDAAAMTKELKAAGFEVIEGKDVSLRSFETKLREFRKAAVGAKAAWFFYAGHGLEVDGRNYLVPVDADVEAASEVKHETLPLERVLGGLKEAGTPLKVIVLDCCRDNPFRGWSRSASKGLAQVEVPRGTIIAYATAPGKVAADGAGKNSPYTNALVEAMAQPGLEIEQVFKLAGQKVLKATGEKQSPWINLSFYGSFRLKGVGVVAQGEVKPVEQFDAGRLAGEWKVVETTVDGDRYVIQWSQRWAVRDEKVKVISGKKIKVNGKEATRGEKQAVLSGEGIHQAKGLWKFDMIEVNYRGEELESQWVIRFSPDGKTFSGTNFEKGKVVSKLTGSR